jgi:RimJ/RimL family protein N-acetyltransferase/predicted N-acetyltransferase YhbS
MRTRTIRANELDLFVESGGAPEHRREVKSYIEVMFAAGSMRPEWCFVLKDGDGAVGRVALWTLPKAEQPLDAVLLEVPWENGRLEMGERLLGDVLKEARSLGVEEIGHVLDAPPVWPQYQRFPEERAELLGRAGFAPKRATVRFEWSDGPLPEASGRLVFRALEEVGEEAFVDAVARVTEGTLDRDMSEEKEKQGPLKAAREFFEEEQDMEYEPGWWELAYAPEGDLVGLIMPARNPTSPVIDYIGVVPERRGEGYVDDLLARGAATLLSAGAEQIRADTDTANAPMADAFRRAGYAEFARRREYEADLSRPSRHGFADGGGAS